MIGFYYYDAQLRNYLLQFCNIFAGLQVKTGKGTCEAEELITVPIAIGSRDRVVAAIEAGNTQAKPFSLPTMAANMSGLARNDARRHGVSVVDRRVYLPEGGVYPTDLKTVVRVMPIPYMMTLDLSIYASNMQQMHQILEQILMLFDPAIQIQTTDSAFDWTKITTVELTSINNEENYPAGGDRRTIVWSLSFDMPIYIATPMDIKKEFIEKIFIRLGNLGGFTVNEYGEDGQLQPFTPEATYATIEVDAPEKV
jgi:T4-like virus Myoviridae tail sheath stabiliser